MALSELHALCDNMAVTLVTELRQSGGLSELLNPRLTGGHLGFSNSESPPGFRTFLFTLRDESSCDVILVVGINTFRQSNRAHRIFLF